MGEISYGGFILDHISESTTVPLIERRMRYYMNEAIKKRDNVDTDYYPEVGSGIKAVIFIPDENNTTTKIRKAIVYGINFPLDFIRFAIKGRDIDEDDIIIIGPDIGVPRGNDAEFLNWHDKVYHDNILKGCGVFDHPLPIFTDKFWEEIGCTPSRIKNTFKMDYHKGQLNIDGTVKQDKGFLQHVNFKVSDTQKGTKFECYSKFEAGQIFRFRNRCPDLCKKNSYPFQSIRQVATIPHVGFGINGTYLDVRAEMENHKCVRFCMLREDLYHKYRVETLWRSRCVHCKSHYVIHGFHPDLNWLAAKCQCPTSSLRQWPGEDFFRVTLAYPQARSNPKFEHTSKLSSPPLILMTKGLLPQYDSVEDFRTSCLAAEEHECEVVQQELAAKHIIGKIYTISKPIETKWFKDEGCYKTFYSLEFQVKSHGVWTPEERHCISAIKITPVNRVRKNDDGSTPSVDVLKNHTSCIEGKLERIRKGNNYYSIVETRIWVPTNIVPRVQAAYYMIPIPPKGFKENIERAIDEWSVFVERRSKVTPRTNVTIFDSTIVSCDMELPHQENQVKVPPPEYNRIRFRIKKNFVTNIMLQKRIVFNLNYYIVLCSDLENTGKHDEKTTFNGIMTDISVLDQSTTEVCITAIIKCHRSHVIMDRPALVSMWIARDDSVLMDLPIEQHCFKFPGKQDLEEEKAKKNGVAYQVPKPPSTNEDFIKLITPCPVKVLFDLRDFMLKKDVPGVQHFVKRAAEKWATALNISVKDKLNASQLQAVISAINNVIGLVEGPPGCGKTWLICWLVMELMRKYQKSGMILIATPTNQSGDVCAQLLQKLNREQGDQLVIRRMMAFGKEESPKDGVEDLSVHTAITNHTDYRANKAVSDLMDQKKNTDGRNLLTEEEDKEIKDHLNDIRMKVLDKTDVLICTLDTANNKTMQAFFKSMDKPLHGVIIDESNMATSPQHLRLLALNPAHYVMVGDDRQLRKCYSSRTATNANADVSLMRFLMTTRYFQEIAKPVMLIEQYRFPLSICEVISRWAYGGKLIPAVFGMPEVPVHLYEGLLDRFPQLRDHNMIRVTYDQAQALEKQFGPSYYNLKEAALTVALLRILVENVHIPVNKITILALYAAQLTEIKKYINGHPDTKKKYENINLCTADSFEGRESNIVIVSLVRSNDKTKVGFMRDPSRLTVAISRCQHYMFWVSNEETFKTCKLRGIEELYKIMDTQKVPIAHWNFEKSNFKKSNEK